MLRKKMVSVPIEALQKVLVENEILKLEIARLIEQQHEGFIPVAPDLEKQQEINMLNKWWGYK